VTSNQKKKGKKSDTGKRSLRWTEQNKLRGKNRGGQRVPPREVHKRVSLSGAWRKTRAFLVVKKEGRQCQRARGFVSCRKTGH